MRVLSVITLLAVLAAGSRGAAAAPVIYTDLAAFNAAIAGATVTTQDFDSTLRQGSLSTLVGPNNHTATVGGLTLRSSRQIFATSAFGSTDSAVGSNFTLGAVGGGSFGFEGLTANFFGILLAAERGRTPTLSVLVDGVSVGTQAVSSTEQFIGVIDTAGTFSSVAFAGATNTTGFTTFDDARYGSFAVPAPGMPFLGAVALLGLLGLTRARKARA